MCWCENKSVPFSLGVAAEVPRSKVTYVAPWESHVDVVTSAAHIDPEGCGAGQYYRIDLSKQGANAKLSTILAAYMAGKDVGLSIGGCLGNAPEIQGVRF